MMLALAAGRPEGPDSRVGSNEVAGVHRPSTPDRRPFSRETTGNTEMTRLARPSV